MPLLTQTNSQYYNNSNAGNYGDYQYVKFTDIVNQFIMAYPDLSVYKMWQPPSLKVRAGNCRNRFEAEGIKKSLEEAGAVVELK